MGIGDKIKQRREAIGMSQAELANKLGYTSRSSINKIEKDINDIPQSKIIAFAEVLKTTPAFLMDLKDGHHHYDMSIINKIDDIMVSNDEARKKLIKAIVELPMEDILFMEKMLDALNEKKLINY